MEKKNTKNLPCSDAGPLTSHDCKQNWASASFDQAQNV